MSFQNESEAYRYIGGIFEEAFKDPEIGPKLAATELVLRFSFSEPDAVVIVDNINKRTLEGDTSSAEPHATMAMKAEIGNAYWQGKVNLPFAMAKGKIAVEGNVASLLKIAPLGKKLFPIYIDRLKADGRDDLLVQ